MRFRSYDTQGFYDEMFEDDGRPRAGAQLLIETVEALSDGICCATSTPPSGCCSKWASPSMSTATRPAPNGSSPST
jgi:hypothetical protein